MLNVCYDADVIDSGLQLAGAPVLNESKYFNIGLVASHTVYSSSKSVVCCLLIDCFFESRASPPRKPMRHQPVPLPTLIIRRKFPGGTVARGRPAP